MHWHCPYYFFHPKQHTDIFDLVSGIQKETIKEEKLEKERRRALKERKQIKKRQRGKELDPEQEDKDEEVLLSRGVQSFWISHNYNEEIRSLNLCFCWLNSVLFLTGFKTGLKWWFLQYKLQHTMVLTLPLDLYNHSYFKCFFQGPWLHPFSLMQCVKNVTKFRHILCFPTQIHLPSLCHGWNSKWLPPCCSLCMCFWYNR